MRRFPLNESAFFDEFLPQDSFKPSPLLQVILRPFCQEDIRMIPDRPLVLYSTTPQGARIPQYALTFVTYEEASHA